MTSSNRSGALPPDTSEPARPGAGPKLLSGTTALRLAASDGGPVPSTRTDPDRPLGEVPGPMTTLDKLSFDPSVPHPARIYGYWLGGKDHYPADRRAAEEVMRLRPQVVASARANRYFLARVVRFLAANYGIRQFLDIGTGMPVPGSTHEIAQQAAPDSKIVYVDNDPVVLVHARALLGSTTAEGTCGYVDADLHEPGHIVAQAAQTLDFTQPVAVLLLAVVHFIADADDPASIVAVLASALAPGSYLAVSHLTGDFAPEHVAAAVAAYNEQVPVSVTARTHSQVTGLFGGLPLLAPGVVPVTEWRPEAGDPFGQPADLHGGVARIPGRARPGSWA